MVTPFRNNIPTRVHERIVFNSPLSLPFAPIYSDIDKFVRVIFRRIDGTIRWISGWIVIGLLLTRLVVKIIGELLRVVYKL